MPKQASFSVRLQNSQIELEIIAGLGGFLNSFCVKRGGNWQELIVGYPSEAEAIKNHQKLYRSARLSPFPNRLKDGKYIWEGKEYQFPINFPGQNHALHGLLAKASYQVSQITDAQLILKHSYNQQVNGYPFSFQSEICYELTESGFACKTTIKNTGSSVLPIGEGWHPYFQLEGNLADWKLQLNSCQEILVDDRMLPTGELSLFDTFIETRAIGNTHFDTCFTLPNKAEKFQSILASENIRLSVWQNCKADGYKFLQLFTPSERNSIAIEPMTCAPDAFNNQIGIKKLKPAQIWELAWGAEVSVL